MINEKTLADRSNEFIQAKVASGAAQLEVVIQVLPKDARADARRLLKMMLEMCCREGIVHGAKTVQELYGK